MAIIDLTAENLDACKEQVKRLNADSERQWGEMDVVRMLRHLRTTIAISLGEVEEVKDISVPLVRNLVWFLFFVVFNSFPKSKLKAPDYWTPACDADFDSERGQLLSDMDRFVERLKKDPNEKQITPLIGPLTLTKWAHFHGVHFNHHLKQFGIQ